MTSADVSGDRPVMEAEPAVDAARPVKARRYPNNLPLELNRFIGRERELREIKPLLWSTRLLTLTGPGGCGKTRLALRLAADLLDAFADGVWLVELAALSDPALVPQAVASAVELREQVGRPVQQVLIDYFESREALLVLDNCEHLILACAQLAEELLRACPNLRILATSREALNIAGEIAWLVPPLSLPDPKASSQADSLQQSEAAQLFIERATTAQPAFATTQQNAAAITEICQRLDGLPLAIELAAARVKTLSVQEISARLDDRFRFLTQGTRTALSRHQALRAAIDWSCNLLPPEEQTLFRRVSVFAGGWGLDAAEAVCGGDGLESKSVLDVLGNLVDKSLVQARSRSGETRYTMLDSLRLYATEKLRASSEDELTRDQHFAYFLRLAEEAEPKLNGAEQMKWFTRLEAEHDNLRVAFAWSLGNPRIQTTFVLRLVTALWWFWYGNGYFDEGCQWLESALAQDQSSNCGLTVARVRALSRWGYLVQSRDGDEAQALVESNLQVCQQAGDTESLALALVTVGFNLRGRNNLEQSEVMCQEGFALFRDIEHPWGMSLAYALWSDIAWRQNDYERAAALSEQSLALRREIGDTRGIARSLAFLGQIAQVRGDYAQAKIRLLEALAFSQELSARYHRASVLANLGAAYRDGGDFEQAALLLNESLKLCRDTAHPQSIAIILHELGVLAWQQGDYEHAIGHLEESWALAQRLESLNLLPRVLLSLGDVARAQKKLDQAITSYKAGLSLLRKVRLDRYSVAEALRRVAVATSSEQPNLSVRLFASADRLYRELGAALPPVDRAEVNQAVADLHTSLGDAKFAVLWAEGRMMAVEHAIAYALAEIQTSASIEQSSSTLPSQQDLSRQFGGLTAREREIATLVAQGQSNREIAATLVLSERTVASHVSNILSKLEFNSRTQIATWANEKGLTKPPV